MTLPPRLQTLTFASDFDQSLEQVTLPATLQRLTFGCSYNQSLKGVLFPEKLEYLVAEGLCRSLDEVDLPSSLKTLGLRKAVLSVE